MCLSMVKRKPRTSTFDPSRKNVWKRKVSGPHSLFFGVNVESSPSSSCSLIMWSQEALCATPPVTPGPGEDRRPFPSFPAKDLALCCSVSHHQPCVAIDIQVLKIK